MIETRMLNITKLQNQHKLTGGIQFGFLICVHACACDKRNFKPFMIISYHKALNEETYFEL